MRLADFQHKLTEEIINGSGLQTIADKVFTNLDIPIVIQDSELRTIVYSGLSEERFLELQTDIEQFIQENKQKNPFFQNAV